MGIRERLYRWIMRQSLVVYNWALKRTISLQRRSIPVSDDDRNYRPAEDRNERA